jgi:arabinose-5-phosphate isomerase
MTQAMFVESGRAALSLEAEALVRAAKSLGESFELACGAILRAPGKVVLTGLGKSGHVSRKISATLASTGTPSIFLHPAEALHGDLGVIQKHDVLVSIAFGGETEEVLAVTRYAKRLGVPVVAITGKLNSTLARLADHVIDGTVQKEVCPHNLAPTASTTVALGLGDAIAIAVMQARGFKQEDFAALHPSGALGRRLATVKDLMQLAGQALPSVDVDSSFTSVLAAITKKNFGIVPVLGSSGELLGAISDGDIRRILLEKGDQALALKAADFMTRQPKTIASDHLAIDAFKRMEAAQITSLFVQDQDKLLGLVRMHDLLAAKIV